MFGSFLKFANFDDFFSSLQDDISDNNNSNNHHDNDDGAVYLLSGCELPEQDLLEDTDFDLR